MYLIGIDISKYKHDCFIDTEIGEVVYNSFHLIIIQMDLLIFFLSLILLMPIKKKEWEWNLPVIMEII